MRARCVSGRSSTRYHERDAARCRVALTRQDSTTRQRRAPPARIRSAADEQWEAFGDGMKGAVSIRLYRPDAPPGWPARALFPRDRYRLVLPTALARPTTEKRACSAPHTGWWPSGKRRPFTGSTPGSSRTVLPGPSLDGRTARLVPGIHRTCELLSPLLHGTAVGAETSIVVCWGRGEASTARKRAAITAPTDFCTGLGSGLVMTSVSTARLHPFARRRSAASPWSASARPRSKNSGCRSPICIRSCTPSQLATVPACDSLNVGPSPAFALP